MSILLTVTQGLPDAHVTGNMPTTKYKVHTHTHTHTHTERERERERERDWANWAPGTPKSE